ncbi:unnamed protein product [Candidula unifasciata]|uniref:G-protein coupled receptors family 1 profile domain-containing protein n=1 Tax=Candidula unifasciata TaxID=100452 RepID=A0A8S3ZIQ1_9EUPU|nr:unnamed protein product [Candidula unifasciata]
MNTNDCAPRDGTNLTRSGPDPWRVVISVSFSSLVVFIIAANITTIVSMLRSMYIRKTTQRTSRDKVLIVSMSVGDLFLGAFPTSLVVYEATSGGIWLLGTTVCAIRYLSDLCLCTVSIYHVMFMAVDRYLAVCKPLLHRTLPKKTEYIMVLISWIVPTALVFLPILGHSYGFGGQYTAECPHTSSACFVQFNRVYLIIFIITSIILPLVIVLIIYYTGFSSCVSSSPFQLSSISSSLSSSSSSSLSMSSSSYTSPGSNTNVLKGHAEHTEYREANDQVVTSRKTGQPTKQNLKAVKTIGVIVVCFVVCWFPTAVQLTLDAASISSCPKWLKQVFTWLAYLNSGLNSALYCANTSMRQRMRHFFCETTCLKPAN